MTICSSSYHLIFFSSSFRQMHVCPTIYPKNIPHMHCIWLFCIFIKINYSQTHSNLNMTCILLPSRRTCSIWNVTRTPAPTQYQMNRMLCEHRFNITGTYMLKRICKNKNDRFTRAVIESQGFSCTNVNNAVTINKDKRFSHSKSCAFVEFR